MDEVLDGVLSGTRHEERTDPRPGMSGWVRVGVLCALVMGGALATRSAVSLLARVDQLEREAAESEARVAELQQLRDGMARRMRQLEEQLKPATPPPSAKRQAQRSPALSH